MTELANELEGFVVFKEIIREETLEDGTIQKVKIIYCKDSLSDKIKGYKKKYYEGNKDKVIETTNKYIQERRKNDEDFAERLREIKRNSYHRMKEKKLKEKEKE
jgi:hypothetical protein